MIPSVDTLRRASDILQEMEKLRIELVGLFGESARTAVAKARRGRPPGRRRRMSSEARARIATAAKARWARYRADKKGTAK